MLQQTVVKENCHAGLATDGDADRLGAVAEDGSFVDSHKIFSVILQWLLERKKWPGEVVRAFNTTRMIDRIAAKHGRKVNECPIGFKYAADLMMEREILIGGEESGGIGYSRFLPERDGLLNSLLLANVMAEERKPLGQLVADLQQRVWSALLRAARSSHPGRGEATGHPARTIRRNQPFGKLCRLKKGEPRRNKVLPRCAHQRQWCRSLGVVPSLGDGAAAARVCGGRIARVGHRNLVQR